MMKGCTDIGFYMNKDNKKGYLNIASTGRKSVSLLHSIFILFGGENI